jgi:hypothetical protein
MRHLKVDFFDHSLPASLEIKKGKSGQQYIVATVQPAILDFFSVKEVKFHDHPPQILVGQDGVPEPLSNLEIRLSPEYAQAMQDGGIGFKRDPMKAHFFTLGQTHKHLYELPAVDEEEGPTSIILDRNGWITVFAKSDEAARDKMFELFDQKWAMHYTDPEAVTKAVFPRGCMVEVFA